MHILEIGREIDMAFSSSPRRPAWEPPAAPSVPAAQRFVPLGAHDMIAGVSQQQDQARWVSKSRKW
jgi:hypothetical protein